MRYEYTDGCNQDFIGLCHSLDEYLNNIVDGEENRSQYIPYNALEDIHDVILAYDDVNPVGCAAFKYYANKTAEVKRVFIKENYRGKRISKEIMNLIEQRAKEKGFTKLILETGELLVEAMHLYQSLGFVVIPNYAPYENMMDSVCMEKKLLK